MTKQDEIKAVEDLKRLESNSNSIHLERPCRMQDGIFSLDKFSGRNAFQPETSYAFFIPASGAGSRMFAFLHEFLITKVESDSVSIFFKNLDKFAFFSRFGTIDLTTLSLHEKLNITQELLYGNAFGFNDLPKGLIPFYSNDSKEITPFQEHVSQAFKILGTKTLIEFTVSNGWRDSIASKIAELEKGIEISYSYQDESTDAFCFDQNHQLIMENGEAVRRPAGHGALLKNLNELDADVVLIKNIDNIQFGGLAEISFVLWNQMLECMRSFRNELIEVLEALSYPKLIALNETYQFLSQTELEVMRDLSEWGRIKERPTRICGMVKNQGKPGGGPFWVEIDGQSSKQIVEKAQVNENDPEQMDILDASTHFNPVFIAVDKRDLAGNRLDLLNFRNDDLCIKVSKQKEGKLIRYCELPGLWNGSMHNYNSLFVEIPVEAFTPVKSAIDLL